MTDISIDSAQAADDLLGALSEQLAAQRECFTIAVVGGSALLALGLISRTTRDVDVLAIVDGGELTSAQPLPAALVGAAQTVARDFGLSKDWLNPGPTSLLDLGLPEGFLEREGAGKHLNDLQALAPTERELLDAASWSQTNDPSDG